MLERIDGFLSERDLRERMPTYGKVASAAVGTLAPNAAPGARVLAEAATLPR